MTDTPHTAQLFPRLPRRMKQPTKAVLRDNLARAAAEIERLRCIVSLVEIAIQQNARQATSEGTP